MFDSVHVFAIGLQTLEQSHTLRISNVSCEDELPWDGGLSLINYINSVWLEIFLAKRSVFFLRNVITGGVQRAEWTNRVQRGPPHPVQTGLAQVEAARASQSGRVVARGRRQHHRPRRILRPRQHERHPRRHHNTCECTFHILLLITNAQHLKLKAFFSN